MSRGFPIELRERIVAARDQGLSGRAIARLFNVGHSTVHRYLRKMENGESLEPGTPPGAAAKLGSDEMHWLGARLSESPYMTSYELAAKYNAAHRDNRVHRSTILRAMHNLGFTQKKKTPIAPQRDRDDVVEARRTFARQQRKLEASDLIFIDETGCHPGIGPLRGWAPKGAPLIGAEQVYARKQHISIVGAMRIEGILARMTVRGGVGSPQFRRFVERYLVPQLRPGHIVLWDNLNAHKNKLVREMVEARGAEIRFLPPYSPDLNPIEAAWSKLKHFIRKAWSTGIKDLRQAIYRAFRRIHESDARGWFEHAGYQLSQLQ